MKKVITIVLTAVLVCTLGMSAFAEDTGKIINVPEQEDDPNPEPMTDIIYAVPEETFTYTIPAEVEVVYANDKFEKAFDVKIEGVKVIVGRQAQVSLKSTGQPDNSFKLQKTEGGVTSKVAYALKGTNDIAVGDVVNSVAGAGLYLASSDMPSSTKTLIAYTTAGNVNAAILDGEHTDTLTFEASVETITEP